MVTKSSGKESILKKKTLQMCHLTEEEGKPANFCVPACEPVYVSHNPEGRQVRSTPYR